jgi:hypothetical protein
MRRLSGPRAAPEDPSAGAGAGCGRCRTSGRLLMVPRGARPNGRGLVMHQFAPGLALSWRRVGVACLLRARGPPLKPQCSGRPVVLWGRCVQWTALSAAADCIARRNRDKGAGAKKQRVRWGRGPGRDTPQSGRQGRVWCWEGPRERSGWPWGVGEEGALTVWCTKRRARASAGSSDCGIGRAPGPAVGICGGPHHIKFFVRIVHPLWGRSGFIRLKPQPNQKP